MQHVVDSTYQHISTATDLKQLIKARQRLCLQMLYYLTNDFDAASTAKLEASEVELFERMGIKKFLQSIANIADMSEEKRLVVRLPILAALNTIVLAGPALDKAVSVCKQARAGFEDFIELGKEDEAVFEAGERGEKVWKALARFVPLNGKYHESCMSQGTRGCAGCDRGRCEGDEAVRSSTKVAKVGRGQMMGWNCLNMKGLMVIGTALGPSTGVCHQQPERGCLHDCSTGSVSCCATRRLSSLGKSCQHIGDFARSTNESHLVLTLTLTVQSLQEA